MVTNRIAGKNLNYKSYLDAHALEIQGIGENRDLLSAEILKFFRRSKDKKRLFESVHDPSNDRRRVKAESAAICPLGSLRGACTSLIIPRVPVTNARNAVSFPAVQFHLSVEGNVPRFANERTKKKKKK